MNKTRRSKSQAAKRKELTCRDCCRFMRCVEASRMMPCTDFKSREAVKNDKSQI